ncbi:Mov34/MPN/PAD-1 family protein [Falsibacillus albus]|nr:Mov34/MPN/PAD-1 family protein [Falsibacillus albus]
MKLSRQLYNQLIHFVERELPKEACGILGGVNDHILSIFALPNESNTNKNFYVRQEHVEIVFNKLAHYEQEVLAIYHSHPNSNPIPSQSDIQFHPDSQVKMAIMSYKNGNPQLKIYRIINGIYINIPFSIIE